MEFVSARMQIGDQVKEIKVDSNSGEVIFNFAMKPGFTWLQTWLKDDAGIERGAYICVSEKIKKY